ncbi:MAG: prohibitin family protein [Clostridia bacterium]|nr:prohibitin family protein [Clostridia bacterium]
MGYIVLTLITAAILFVVLGISGKSWRVRRRQWLAALGAFWLLIGAFAVVPTGHTGILTTFGKVEDTTLEAGLHFKLPVQEVVVMDNRTQKSVVELSCFSSDIQEVTVKYSINYQIQKTDAQNIYKTIGVNYYDVVMQPRIEVAVRSVIAKYTAETLIENRDTLSSQITDILLDELATYNIDVVNTAIEDMDFSDVFTQAVEAKQVAQQEKLKAETEQEQKTMEEQAAADRQVIAATAEAEVAQIQAQADAEVLKIQADAAEYAGQRDAAVNKALAESLDETLLEYYAIKQWDGKMPDYLAGADESGILSLIYGMKDQATEETPAPAPAQ